ncbi:LacI family transcriptional regulator (plasmid) [Cetobacterium somerae]|uniref:LacI family DNA-binding transcriptional regulator n=1 Tax=Cetobacterium TaxID=180162 RepID=UPI001F0680A5|nr:LacI family DNA-binding transcriptional regulator [Cetobacterium somerae]UPO98588.1 LacI family transcriptional regulator [Cetobacterium somerae]
MRVTIKDIAKELNISTAAVSKALNNLSGVSEELRERVKIAAKGMGYTPNLIAKNLVQNRTNKIALFILSRKIEDIRFSFLDNEIFRYLINESHKIDYNILVFSVEDTDEQKNYIDLCRSENVTGAIILGIKLDDPQIKDLKENKEFPVVVFDTNIGGDVNSVKTDNELGVKKVTDYLKEMNHEKVGVITGHFKAQVSIERLYTFTNQMIGKEIEIYEGDFSKESGYKGAKVLYKKGVTALFAFSDLMALGALEYFNENNIKVPDEISLIGFDDIPVGEILKPGLTTIAHSKKEIAKKMLRMIIENEYGKNIKIEPKLIKRDSVKKL